ncbi:MAG TPA: TonB-dependent receptor, partial [Candidatus Bathyarchaeia archaeon]|nr:TonB-dependent receptor [Candidatus Bathyarchaeia archaeon]
MKRIYALSYCFLLCALPASAQQVVDLSPIVISGTRLIESPSSLESSRLETEDLGRRGIADLSTALQEVQGVDIYSSSVISGAGAVSIRGMDSTYTQVMYNGIKMFDPISTTGYFSGYRYFPLATFDEVQILKGPYSSLYGSGGIGGNIHLTSERGEGKPTWTYRQEVGSYRTFMETLKVKGESGNLDYAFHASREDVGSMYATRYKEGNHETDPLGITSLGGRLDYDMNDEITIGGMGDFVSSRYEYDGSAWTPPYNPVDDDSNVENYAQGVGMVYIEQKVSCEFEHKLSVGGNRVYRKGQDSSADVWYDGVSQQVKYDGVWDILSWDRVSFGADYLEEKGESFWGTYNPKRSTNTRGVFIQNRVEPLEGTRLITGTRLEDHSSFGHQGTYSIRGEQDVVDGGTVYGSYGTGFKAPSLYQLYAPTYGTSDLGAEQSASFEVGYDQRINQVSFGQAFFQTDIDDMIDFNS